MNRRSTWATLSVLTVWSTMFVIACGGVPASRGEPASSPQATAGSVQTSASVQPYSLADVEEMVRGGMRTVRVLELVRQDCIAFRVTGEVIARLTAAGADDALISGLRTTCQRP